MQVSYLMSSPSLKKLDVSPIHVAFGDFMQDSLYSDAYASSVDRGGRLYQYGTPLHDLCEGAVARSSEELADMEGVRRGIVVRDKYSYLAAAGSDFVDFIAVEGYGPDRVSMLRSLVRSGAFCPKPHWLWGLPNPAELCVYRSLFTNYVLSVFEVAVCESCFAYSMYGARFSQYRGTLATIPSSPDGMLGMRAWYGYEPCSEQYRVFYENQDIVDRFSRGDGAPEYEDWLYAILEEEDEEEKEGIL